MESLEGHPPLVSLARPERLIRIRGRHSEDLEMVLPVQEETLDYEHIVEAARPGCVPLVQHLKTIFGVQTFGPRN